MIETEPLTAPALAPKDESATWNGLAQRPSTLAAASALLLALSFPPVDLGFLGWFALVPLFLLVRSEARAARLYGAAWFGGLLFGAIAVFWITRADVVGWIALALFMSFWWPLFLLATRLAVRRVGVPLMIAAPVAWVGMEYAKAHVLSGFPWYYLAHTQYAYLPMIQVCDLFGAWGLSLLMATANALWVDLLTRPLMHPTTTGPRFDRLVKWKIGIVGVFFVLTLLYGVVRMATSHFREGPRVALLQSDFPQDLKNGIGSGEMLVRLRRLLDQALAADPKPDLIVWPETAYAPGFVTIDPALSEAEFAQQARRYHPESTPDEWRMRQSRSDLTLRMLAEESSIPMVLGAPSYEFGPRGLLRRNSAALFGPGGARSTVYHKQALVPMGEYIPFLEQLPWLLALTPYTDGYVPSLKHGTGPVVLESKGVRYAPTICFEDTIPHVVRASALASKGEKRPDILLNLTNDGWFRGSSEQQAHLAIAAFRAVECRRPLVRAVNTGISAIIDANGRVVQTLPIEKEEVLIGTVPLDDRSSLYLIVGDTVGAACLSLSILGVVASIALPRHLSRFARKGSVG